MRKHSNLFRYLGCVLFVATTACETSAPTGGQDAQGSLGSPPASKGGGITSGSATLYIEDSSLPPGVMATASEEQVAAPTKGAVLTKPSSFTFSDVAFVGNEPMRVSIAIPDSEDLDTAIVDNGDGWVDAKLFAMVHMSGEQPGLGHGATNTWSLVLGELDREKRTYTIPLFSTAETVSVVLVRRDDLRLWTGKIAGTSAMAADRGWASNPWLVICETATPNDCALWKESIELASKHVYDLGFDEAFLLQTTINGQAYNVTHVFATHNEACSATGAACWFSSNGKIAVGANYVGRFEIPVHELVHAAQAAMAFGYAIGAVWYDDILYFVEGTAELVGYEATNRDLLNSPPRGWRNWSRPQWQDSCRL